jgi:hypothetical protein
MAIDQNYDYAHPEHNLTISQVQQKFPPPGVKPGKEALLAIAEFDSAGGFVAAWPKNEDPPPIIGTDNLQHFDRVLAAQAGQFPIERKGVPTAVLCSLDSGETWGWLSEM